MPKNKKVRINLVTDSLRLTDISLELANVIDMRRMKDNLSRVEYIRSLTHHKLYTYDDVLDFREYLKKDGYESVEDWLNKIHKIKVKK
jgi:hypothetical protein